MRVLVISDIHGNLHALDAVLTAAGEVDALWNLGDVVGYGAYPNEVVDCMKQRAQINVRGNHDRVCCGLTTTEGFNPVAATAATWTKSQLTPKNLQWLREMPKGPVAAAGRAMCAHGSPLHEDQYIVTMRDAWTPLQKMASEITFFGHTHVQGGFSQREHDWHEHRPMYAPGDAAVQWGIEVPEGTRHLVNPGSVGQPRDRDWRAGFAVYDTDAHTVMFYRVPYDVAAAQAAIREAGLPERLAARLKDGR